MDEAARYGVDQIRQIEHYGRYTTTVAIPRRFIWEPHRERKLDCPLIEWRIRDKWFRAVIPAEPDRNGWLDKRKAELKLRELISTTLPPTESK